MFADKAQEEFYSLEIEESVVQYTKALEIEPENPDYWTRLAHSYLFLHLKRTGRLDAEIYTASNHLMPPADLGTDTEAIKTMWSALGRARSICEKRIAGNPRDADAYYYLGLVYSIEANFHVNAARKPLDALRPGNKAKELHERALRLDPTNHDANLVIGLHMYVVGSVPASFRWILYLAGYSGSRERGVQLAQDALLNGKRGPGLALVVLAYMYNREKKYAYCRTMLQHLLRFYPRSYLAEMEIAETYLKENNLEGALTTYRNVAHKVETGAPGYGRMNRPRLYFQLGSLAAQSHPEQAIEDYARVLEPASDDGKSLERMRAHTLLRMGDLYARLNRKEEARRMYERATQAPFSEVSGPAKTKLKSL